MVEINKLDKIKSEGSKISREVKEKTFGFVVTALGLVAGLAWNEAIQSLIKSFFAVDKDSVLAKFIYAIVITVVVVIITVYLTRLFGKDEENNKK